MARLKALPHIDIIKGFRGVLDFYVWKGLACVRRWPNKAHAKRSAAEIAAGLTFGAIVKAWSLVDGAVKALYDQDAADHPRTGRDIYVSGTLGHLHEATMTNFLDLLTEAVALLNVIEDLTHALHSIGTDFLDVHVHASVLPEGAATLAEQETQTTALELIDDLRNALHSVATDFLDVHVHASVLPTGAGTAANQATMITALQKLDDLQDALQSVDTDALQVRGRDQLFSIQSVIAYRLTTAISGAGGYIESVPVGAGTYWIITTMTASDATTAPTKMMMGTFHNGAIVLFNEETKAFVPGQRSCWSGQTILDVDDTIRAYFVGGLAGDTCQLEITGFNMTLET